jgi:hypothetical protein
MQKAANHSLQATATRRRCGVWAMPTGVRLPCGSRRLSGWLCLSSTVRQNERMHRRVPAAVSVAILLGIAVALAGYAYFGDTSIRQARRMSLAREHLAGITNAVHSHPEFRDVRVGVGTGAGGCFLVVGMLTRALQRTAAPLGSWTVQVICSRLLQPTGRFRRRSLSLVVKRQILGDSGRPEHDIVFEGGSAVSIICPELGRCPITDAE